MLSAQPSRIRRAVAAGLTVVLAAALVACTGGSGEGPSGTSAAGDPGDSVMGGADPAAAAGDVPAGDGGDLTGGLDDAAGDESLVIPTAETIAAAGEAAAEAAVAQTATADAGDADPTDVAEALVDVIYGPDPEAANAATAELLRRVGLPLVKINGEIVAMPDGLVAVNEPVYVELVPSLTGALRTGAMFAPNDITELLQIVEVTPEQWPDELLVGTLAQWGKTEGAPVESRIAGAAVRASAWHRDQLLVPGDADITIDPLAQLLLLGHLGAQVYAPASVAEREAEEQAPGLRAPGAAFVAAGSTLCEAIDEWMTDNPEIDGTVGKELDIAMGKAIEEAVDVASSAAQDVTGKIRGTIGKIAGPLLGPLGTLAGMATKIFSVALLLDGIRGTIEDDKSGYLHFKHPDESGEDGRYGPWRIRLRGTVSFVSAIPDKDIGCWGLAGVKVPHTGPLKGSDGYRASWNFGQGTSALLYAAKKDSKAYAESTSLDDSGHTTTVEAYTKWEKWPDGLKDVDKYAIRTERTQVKIIVSKSRVNKNIWDWVDAVSTNSLMWDYAIAKLLPNFIRMMPVESHVPDQYVIRGHGDVYIPLVGDLQMWTDLVSCQGPSGPYHGSAKLHATDGGLAEMIAEAIPKVNGLLAVADGLTGGKFGGAQIGEVERHEGDTEGGWESDNVEVSLFDAAAGGSAQGELGDDLGLVATLQPGLSSDKHVDGVVGQASWTLGGQDISPIADYWLYQKGLTFEVIGVPADSQCPGGESEWVHDR